MDEEPCSNLPIVHRFDPPGTTAHNDVCTKCSNCVTVTWEQGHDWNECGRCRYMDRPFGWNSYGDLEPCTCRRFEVLVKLSTCLHCKNPKCRKCHETSVSNAGNLCTVCALLEEHKEKERSQKEFNRRWRTMSIEEKLQVHGMNKLYHLAMLKGFWKIGDAMRPMTKGDLIKELAPLCSNTDFPIPMAGGQTGTRRVRGYQGTWS